MRQALTVVALCILIHGGCDRDASVLVRQLFDIQQGTRRGAGTDLMKIIVSKLDAGDMASIAAYVASKFPPDPADSEAAAQLAASSRQ